MTSQIHTWAMHSAAKVSTHQPPMKPVAGSSASVPVSTARANAAPSTIQRCREVTVKHAPLTSPANGRIHIQCGSPPGASHIHSASAITNAAPSRHGCRGAPWKPAIPASSSCACTAPTTASPAAATVSASGVKSRVRNSIAGAITVSAATPISVQRVR